MKNSKGITLVALVITIVVLLILAGVTISMVLGPNGVLSNAREARTGSAGSTAKEALTTALGSIQTDYYKGDTEAKTFVTKDKLTALLPGYYWGGNNGITWANDGKTATIKLDEKDPNNDAKKANGHSFEAVINDQVTLQSFKMDGTTY